MDIASVVVTIHVTTTRRLIYPEEVQRMMKSLLFFGFLSFQAAVLYGQTLTGTWQGVLKGPDVPNGELRIVIKISTTEADKLAATMYSIDQGTTPVPSSAVTAKGVGLKMSFERINGTWEGRLSADGK